jgi:hypothetical protein
MRGRSVVNFAAQVDDDGVVGVEGAQTLGITTQGRRSPFCDQLFSGSRHGASVSAR